MWREVRGVAEKKGFDLASVLGGVSGSNTSEIEQIVRIPVELIDPDPENFYSLDGLDGLAANIELIGLQQPLRVRPSGERYVVVSGHRRRAAILMIRNGGSRQFADGVPCIVEYGEASEAMRKLRLIYANSATRVMTSAELSKQAEEVQMLLYELKEQGVEFPGRMRDHVAEACKISASKLARLHAIRSNLEPSLLENYYDKGTLKESSAYALSKLPKETQLACVNVHLATRSSGTNGLTYLWEQTVETYGKEVQRLDKQKCPKSKLAPCCPESETILARRFTDDHFWQCEGCCAKCSRLADCKRVCSLCQDKAAKLKAERKETRKTEKALQRNEDEMKIREIELYWFRFGQALRAAGLSHRELADKMGMKEVCGYEGTAVFNWSWLEKDAEQLEDGSFMETKPSTSLPYGWGMSLNAARNLYKMAGALGVSLDYLFCLTDDPHGVASAAQPGSGAPKLPPRPGEEVFGKMVQLTFDEVAERVGKILVLDRSTESRNSCIAVKVMKIVPYDGMRRAICYAGQKGHELLIDERSFGHPSWPSKMYELAEDAEKRRARAADSRPYGWRTGTPETEGYYAVYMHLYDKALPAPRILWWDGGKWVNSVGDDIRQRPIDNALHVDQWLPLPEEG